MPTRRSEATHAETRYRRLIFVGLTNMYVSWIHSQIQDQTDDVRQMPSPNVPNSSPYVLTISVPVPTTWDNPDDTHTDIKLVTLDKDSPEYQNIAQLFWSTMDKNSTSIVSIQRIQNVQLWEHFSRYVN